MDFTNCYADAARAAAYAKLGFANTYYLAYRDLPEIVRAHVTGTKTIDFGCGTGRSTRFARQLGLDVTGVDIAPEMIAQARALDPDGDYRLIADGDFRGLERGAYDLVLSLFTFDNIPAIERKARLFGDLAGLLRPAGRIVSVVSSPEIYLHEWASFSTRDYPENRSVPPGGIVRIITTDLPDRRPAEDILCPDESYREIYARAGLAAVATYKPLATGAEPYAWVNEKAIAPWVIYVLAKTAPAPAHGDRGHVPPGGER